MKKVISALTAATMVASMSASVMSAFAVYSANDIAFALKVNPDYYYEETVKTGEDGKDTYVAGSKVAQTAKFTVSEDGKTITFASKEDAAGAKFGVGFYILADATNPSVQMVGGKLESDSKSVHFNHAGANLTEAVPGDTERTYNAAGTEFTCDYYVNTFGYLKRGSYRDNTNNIAYGHSSEWLWADSYTGPESLIIQWTYGFNEDEGENPNGTVNTATTAAFLGEKSDDFPITDVTVFLDNDIQDGVYNITFGETYEKVEDSGTSEVQVSFVNVDGKNKVTPATMEGIKIVVGSETPSETESETEATETESESQTEDTQPTETETESQTEDTKPSETEATEPQNFDGYTWKLGDVEYTPVDIKKDYFELPVYVYNDPGTNGFQFKIKVDGKLIDDADCPFAIDEVTKGKGYASFYQFQPNKKNGFVAGTFGESDLVATEDVPVINVVFVPKDGVDYAPGNVYKVEFVTDDPNNAPTFSNLAKETYTDVTLAAGSITIPGGEQQESSETETQPSETETQPSESETQPSETETQPSESETQPSESETQPSESETQPTQPGDYLYGDVNDNGTVELVDIVMLNRFITKYDGQTLNARQIENANCYNNTTPGASTEADLEGLDSVEILKYLIGLVKSLNPGH